MSGISGGNSQRLRMRVGVWNCLKAPPTHIWVLGWNDLMAELQWSGNLRTYRQPLHHESIQVVTLLTSVQLLSHVWLFATPWTAACQASLSITNSWSLLKLMSIESVMPSNHLILYCPLLLPPSIFPSITVCSNVSFLRIRWPKYCSFSFIISPFNE